MKQSLPLLFFALAALAAAQTPVVRPGGALDPSLDVPHAITVGNFHKPLPEEYIWTAGDAAVVAQPSQTSQLKRDDWKVEPRYFRRIFRLAAKPANATLYVAGPRLAKVWINGVPVADLSCVSGHHIGFLTMSADVHIALRAGENVIAIEAVRGHGSHHHANSLKTVWLNSGETLALKILPATQGIAAPALVISDGQWKSTTTNTEGWQKPGFSDSAWKRVVSLGGIESSNDFYLWNADAGMYDWPGYLGEAPYMANYRLAAVKTEQRNGELLLDFGRELNGRLVLEAIQHATTVRIRMGESVGELNHAPYLGELPLTAPAHHEARGPKTGFRYALVDFDPKGPTPTVVAEGIYYPVKEVGSFESNDEQVNKIFETAAYTAHLAEQDSILDGIKRDRGRWIGDDEVIDRVVMDVFGDARLVKAGLDDTLGPAPVTEHVNGIPGYSAWWIVAEYEYVNRTGDLAQARAIQSRMLELLTLMSKDLDARNVFVGAKGEWPFVDWTKDFNTDSAEAQRANHFEYLLAFHHAAKLLSMLGDEADCAKYQSLADAMEVAAPKYLADADSSYGDRWETNAIALLSYPLPGGSAQKAASVLMRTGGARKTYDVISPYYANYVLKAMSSVGDEEQAMSWMKTFWGGMLANGATSFWEAWDPAWTGGDTHAKLDADNQVGYNASLSHGWSSGPAAWLLENVLGVEPLEPEYKKVNIEPKLAGLKWMRGTVATPLGPVKVEARKNRVVVDLPQGATGVLTVPPGVWAENGVRMAPPLGMLTHPTTIPLKHSGHYEFQMQ